MTTLPQAQITSHRHRLRIGVLAASLLLTLALPAAAPASGTQVVADCAKDGKLDKTYTAREYADALKNIPTDVDEYTSCRDIIRRGQLGLAGRHDNGSSGKGNPGAGGGTPSGGPGGPGATPGAGLSTYDHVLAGATPKERAAVQQAAASGAPVQIAGRDLRPDSLGHGDLRTMNSLPAPLIIVLLLLALGAIAATVPTIRAFVRARVQRPV